jgi:predicted DNA-binding protein (MmcQ/YjbR family)
MDRDAVNALCRALPGAEWSDNFGPGHDQWKIGGKLFAVVGGASGGVAVKTPDVDTAAMLIDSRVAERAPYFHRSWVWLPFGAPLDEVRHRIRASYGIVRASLPKKVQAGLGPPGG